MNEMLIRAKDEKEVGYGQNKPKVAVCENEACHQVSQVGIIKFLYSVDLLTFCNIMSFKFQSVSIQFQIYLTIKL